MLGVTTAQVVETSVTVNNNSPIQDYVHPDDQTQPTFEMTPGSGAHQMEPPSPIQALGVNPFPSRFIIRTVPRGEFARRRWEEPITTTK